MLVGFPPAGGISFQKEFSVSTVFSATYKQKFGDTYIFNFVCVQILQNAQSAPQNPQNPRMYPQKGQAPNGEAAVAPPRGSSIRHPTVGDAQRAGLQDAWLACCQDLSAKLSS